MSTVPKVVYGDGVHQVAASARSVTLSDEKGQVLIFSRAAFREVRLAMDRFDMMEEEEETP